MVADVRRALRTWADGHPPLARYVFVFASTSLAAAVNAVLWARLGPRYPLLAFYAAITLCAWFGGLWPGIASAIYAAAIRLRRQTEIRRVLCRAPLRRRSRSREM